MIFEIEPVDKLAAWQLESVPDERTRRSLTVGSAARIVVLVNGALHVAAWVKITRTQSGAYEGITDGPYGVIPQGTLFAFNWRHVADWA